VQRENARERTGFLHMIGSVYLNCCSCGSCSVKHSRHVKWPMTSSGRTSDVRVTTPVMHDSVPMRSVLSARSFTESCRL
jgi:hypothetical protein